MRQVCRRIANDYHGLTYFANLPPDLKERLYYDPNGGSNNLFLKGEYMENPAGSDWMYVNVLSTAQVAEVLGLPTDAAQQAAWEKAIVDGLNSLTNPVVAMRRTRRWITLLLLPRGAVQAM